MADATINRAISIPEFFGDSKKDSLSAKAWCNQVAACQKLSDWNDEKTSQFALLRLRSVAASWCNNQISLDQTAFSTWTKLQKAFLNRFAIRRTLAELAFLKNSLVMVESERVRDFFDRVVSCQIILDEDWEPLPDDASNEQKEVFQKVQLESHTRGVRLNFTAGVSPDIRKLLLVEKIKTNDELLELAERIESSVRDQKRIFNDTKQLEIAASSAFRGRPAARGHPRGRGGRGGGSQKGESRCFLCSSLEHWADKCPNRGRPQFRPRGRGRGQMRGRGGYGQTSKTASVETSQYNSSSDQIGSGSGTNSLQSQQQQSSVQSETPNDPYYHIDQALVELNPFGHQ